MNSASEIIRQPYGSFDGRFPTGIILTVQTPEQWEILTGRKMLRSAEIDELVESDQARLFGLVSLGTAFEHERRHFHDFMLSPIGSALLAQRISAVMNSLQVFARLTDGSQDINALPLPLTRWMEMSVDEQSTYLSSISQFITQSGTSCELVGPTLVAGEPLFEVMAAARHAMKRVMSALTSRCPLTDDFSVGLGDVAEASALVVQAQAIWTWFGESALISFYAGLMTGPKTTYSRMATLLNGLGMPLTTLGALTTWALLGDVQEAPPEYRFAAAVTDVVVNGCPNEAEPLELFDRWDKRFGMKAIPEVMRRSLDSDADLLAKRQQVAMTSGSTLATNLATYYELFCTARRDLVERFLGDPAEYTQPLRYRETTGELREPMVVIAGNFTETPAELESKGIAVIRRKSEDGSERAMAVMLPPANPASTVHPVDSAVEMLHIFLMADAITSDPRDRDDLESIEMIKQDLRDKYYVLRLPL